ncbi:MAG: MBL fold metallo-hydrolase [Pseudomonadota bacterium]
MKPRFRLKGKPKRLTVLDYGLFEVHAGPRTIGICGYVIETDAGEVILIDTGFPEKYAQDADAATVEDALETFGRVLRLTSDNLPRAQLAKCGLQPEAVTLMIQSHTHIDHLGGLSDYRQAPMLIAAAERALDRPLYWSGKQPLAWPDRSYVLVESDTVLGSGFEVLLCPGHAPGQLAFVVDLPDTGCVVLTSDAISRPAEKEEGSEDAWDPDQAAHHAERLMALARDRGAFVIYGHCPAQWQQLKKAPQSYT